jgi:hypothetical protein
LLQAWYINPQILSQRQRGLAKKALIVFGGVKIASLIASHFSSYVYAIWLLQKELCYKCQ